MKSKILIAGLFFAGSLFAAQASNKYEPTEVQHLRLEVKQKDAQIAQQNMVRAQEKFQDMLNSLQAEGDAVRRENHWPDTVTFNPNTLLFSELPKTEKPAEPAKK